MPDLQPMASFDPTHPCLVHDGLNDCTFEWKPEWAGHCREHAEDRDTPGVIAWDGLLLDGWMEFAEAPISPASLVLTDTGANPSSSSAPSTHASMAFGDPEHRL